MRGPANDSSMFGNVLFAPFEHSGMENGETPAGEGPRRDPTESVNERGGLPAPPQESESFSLPRHSYMI